MSSKKSKKSASYNAESIEVLMGLDPVRVRPGMYTDTTHPNHLAWEAIDNSVDEAMAGHASHLDVTVHKDGSIAVMDDGRGMPIDKHPEHKISGVELILTRLHAGAKFESSTYQFSGGLHGVGISVVNALSKKLDVTVKQGGGVHQMTFAGGEPISKLKKIGTCGARETGTMVHFWPDEKYFDSPRFVLKTLRHNLRAKAVLCPGLTVTLTEEASGDKNEWYFEKGLESYLAEALPLEHCLPTPPWVGEFAGGTEEVTWALSWVTEGTPPVTESYVNLIPTAQGGTHVNGLRAGLLEALRHFCELHKLCPKNVKLMGEDLWETCSYVLSLKMQEASFAGQTKERLSSRQATVFVSGVVKDAFSLWLNQHVDEGKAIAAHIIERAESRLKRSRKVVRKKVTAGPALPGKLADCAMQDVNQGELFLVEGDSAGGSAKQARDRHMQAIMPLRGKILNTWEVASDRVLASQEVHDIAIALGVDPGASDISGLRYGKVCILADADSDGNHIATLLCALFVKHFPALIEAGHVYVAMPPLYRIDVGKQVFYALDDSEKQGILDRIEAEKIRGKVDIQRFKGLGEMNPIQLRETTMDPETRRLVQLTRDDAESTEEVMDMLLAKKRAKDRREWLEEKGDLAEAG